MARLGRRGWGVALLLLVACGPGCNTQSLYFFLPENRDDPALRRLAADDAKKEVRVVILTYSNKLETRPELIGAERDLTQAFAVKLQEGCRTNSENVVIVSPRKVEEFKTAHPAWYQADLSDVGRHFKANYVIYLEINHLSFFDKTTANSIYKGNANITVTLYNVDKPEDAPARKEFVCSYPSEAKAIPNDPDNPVSQFRELFFGHMAKKLSWYFTEHLPREAYTLTD
jgi:hypothetical protein